MPLPYYDEQSIAAALAASGRPLLPTNPYAPVELPDATPDWVRAATPDTAPGLQANVPAAAGIPGVAPMVPPTSPYAADPSAGAEIEMPPEAVGPVPLGQPEPAPLPMVAPELPRPGPVPEGPYGSARGVTTADYNTQAAIIRAAESQQQAGLAALQAKAEGVARQATALEGHADRVRATDTAYQLARQRAHEDAAQESATWLAQLDQNAKAEPNPHRAWDNMDNFSKGLWLLSIGMSLRSRVGKTGDVGFGPDPSITQLMGVLHADVEAQKTRLQRERETLLKKGDIIASRQATSLSDLKDDRTMAAERLLALKEAAVVRATAPGSAEQKQAMIAGVQVLDKALLDLADDKRKASLTARESALGRAHAAEQSRLARAQDESQFGRELTYKYDALDRSFSAKSNAGGFEPKDLRPVSRNTGFAIRNQDTGEPLRDAQGNDVSEIVVPKEEYKAVSEAVENATALSRDSQYLRSAYAKASAGSLFIKSDAEAEAVINTAARTWALAHNKGVLSDKDAAAGLIARLGVDRDSLVAKLKGPSKADTLAWLDKQITRGPAEAAEQVTARMGISLPPGYGVTYVPREVTEAPPPTTAARLAEAGVAVSEPPIPKGGPELEAARVAGLLPPLPKGLDPVVTRVESVASETLPRNIPELMARANKAIDLWEAKHKKEPQAAERARYARDRVFAAGQAGASPDKYDAEAQLEVRVGPDFTADEVRKVANVLNLAPTDKEIAELLKAVQAKYASPYAPERMLPAPPRP